MRKDLENFNIYMNSLDKIQFFEPEEEIELLNRIKNNDNAAREIFIKGYLKLVVHIAKRFNNKEHLLDYIEEGNIALIEAIDKFDYSQKNRFSTYAYKCIKSKICRYIKSNTSCIHLPEQVYYDQRKYHKTLDQLENTLNRKPTDDELLTELKWTKNYLECIKTINNKSVTSLNELVDDVNGDSKHKIEIQDLIPSNDELIEDTVTNNSLIENIRDLLKKCNLKENEIKVILLRYGFINNIPYNTIDIGKMYNVSRQRISAIELNALKKLRKSPYIEDFIVYANDFKEASNNLKEYKKTYMNQKKRQNKK